MLKIKGVYDGAKVVLLDPVVLPPNTAVEVLIPDQAAQQEQVYWQHLLETGLIKSVRVSRQVSRHAPAPARVTGEPVSQTIIAERR